eukprot:scaffold2696_cov333-Pavlova_lutheri.AAC.15
MQELCNTKATLIVPLGIRHFEAVNGRSSRIDRFKLDFLHANSQANNALLFSFCNYVAKNPITCTDEFENGTTVLRLIHYHTIKPHTPPPMNCKQVTALHGPWAALYSPSLDS